MSTNSTTNNKTRTWLKPFFVFMLPLLMATASWAQTTLISPTGAGGFESGTTFAANGWTVVNHGTATWQLGSVQSQFAGSRGAFVSIDGGTSWSYNTGLSQTSHFYRDVTVPAGENIINLSFQWKGSGESGWDRLLVYYAPTSVTPVAGTPAANSTALTGATLIYTQANNAQSAYISSGNIALPLAFAGTTFRLIFTWQNDGTAGSNPPVAVDNINLTSQVPTLFTSTTTGGNWSNAATWVNGSVPTANDNVLIADGATVNVDVNNAVCANLTVGQGSSGILEFDGVANSRALAVGANVTIASGGTLRSNTGATTLTHTMTISGDLVNNGTINCNAGTPKLNITFAGAYNSTFTSSGGATNVFNNITVNKTANSNAIDFNPSSAVTLPAGFLTLTSGTFKLSGTQTITNTFFATAAYTIGATAGFWLNNANATVTGQAGSPTLAGLLRISNGLFNIGTTNNSMGFSSGAIITIEGGIINAVARFGVTTAGNAITYNQSGGTVYVNTLAGNTSSTLASFDAGTSTTTSFTMSGGTIVVSKGSANVEYRGPNASATLNITGGTVQLGNNVIASPSITVTPAATTFRIIGVTPNLLVNSNNNPAVTVTTLTTTGLVVRGDLTLAGTGVFNTNNQAVTIAGNSVSNPGNITVPSGATLTLNGGAAVALSFTSSFGNQTFSNAGTITTSQLPSVTVNNTFNSGAGTVTIPTGLTMLGGSTLTLTSGVLTVGAGGTGSITFGTSGLTFTMNRTNGSLNAASSSFGNLATNARTYAYNTSTAAQTVGAELPSGQVISSLTINNASGVISNQNNTVTTTLALTNGVLSGTGTLTIGSSANSTTLGVTRASGSITMNTSNGLTGVTALTYAYNAPTPAASYSTGNELFSGSTLTGLTINNAGQTVTLNVPVTTSGLTLSNGRFITSNTNLITFTGTTPPNGSATAYVQGPLAITVAATAANVSRTFAIGDAGAWRPVVLGAFHNNNTIQTYRATAISGATGGSTSGFSSFNPTRYFEITNTANIFSTTTATVQLSYGADDAFGAPASAVIGQANTANGTYSSRGTGTSVSPTTGIVSNTAITQGDNFFVIGTSLGVYATIANGDWSNAAIWDKGTVPNSATDIISIGHNVTNNAANNYSVGSITITSSGTLNISSGSITVATTVINSGTILVSAGSLVTTAGALTNNAASTITLSGTGIITVSGNTFALTNNGTINVNGGTLGVAETAGASTTGITNATGATFNVAGGTVNLGPTGGGNRAFANNGTGILTVSSGTLNVNGNLVIASGSTFTQSGGNINVDGNAGGVVASSVASGTNIVSIAGSPTTITMSGGTLTVVDPHIGSSTNYAFTVNASTAINFSTSHTLRFGNGSSTDPGLGNGFYMYLFPGSSYGVLGNVVVNSNSSTSINRHVTTLSNIGILGNLTINAGSEYRLASTTYLAGNLVNNGILQTTSTLNFASYSNATVAAATTNQSVTGSGRFRNTAAPSATVSVGGTGYAVGDIITLVGTGGTLGTGATQAQFIVSAVTSGAVTALTPLNYVNYEVLPTTPAATTTTGAGSGLTLISLTNFQPGAHFTSITVNNSSASSGVTFNTGSRLFVSGTLTLTTGFITCNATNALTLGTFTAGTATLSGGSSTSYIKGTFRRVFAANNTAATAPATTILFPVGYSSTYAPFYYSPNTDAVLGGVSVAVSASGGYNGTTGVGIEFTYDPAWTVTTALLPYGVNPGSGITSARLGVGHANVQALAATETQGVGYSSNSGANFDALGLSTQAAGTPNTVFINANTTFTSGLFSYGKAALCDNAANTLTINPNMATGAICASPQYTASGASSTGTTVTVASTNGLMVGMSIGVSSGTGLFAAGTTVSAILSSTDFVVSSTPTTALSGATVYALNVNTANSKSFTPTILPSAAGYTYQWQSSSSVGGPYTNVSYTSAAGATSSGTTITVNSTAGLAVGMTVTVTAGTGAFAANTTVSSITDATRFVVSATPTTALSGGASVVSGNATSINFTTPLLSSSSNTFYRLAVGCIYGGTAQNSAGTQVTVNSLPNVTVSPSNLADVCDGASVNLIATGGTTYSWSAFNGGTQVGAKTSLTNGGTMPSNGLIFSDLANDTVEARPSMAQVIGTSSTVTPTVNPTYFVTVTDANSCSFEKSVTLNVINTAVVPKTLTYTVSPTSVCNTTTPVTVTVNNSGTIGAGTWTYKWMDKDMNTTLATNAGSTLATDDYVFNTSSLGYNTSTVLVSNSLCPASYAKAQPTYNVGFTADNIATTNTNCGNNGTITVYGKGSINNSTWYTNDFTTAPSSANTANEAYFGNVTFTGGRAQLTANSASQNGNLIIKNPTAINTNNLQVDFDLTSSPLTLGASIYGADGFAWSYGPNVHATGTVTPGTTGFNAENGTGSGLKIAFDYTANNAANKIGVYLMYNCQTTDQGPASNGVIAYKAGKFFANLTDAPMSITITDGGYITVKYNNIIIFDNVQLPAAYLAANKSNWYHGFTARTGSAYMLQAIDNLSIKYNSSGGFKYSISTTLSPGTWQNSNLFSNLSAGTYNVFVADGSNTSCFSNVGSAVIGNTPLGTINTIAADGFYDIVCSGSSTTLTTDVTIPNATYDWEQSTNGSSWSNASGTNNTQTYTTPALTSDMYYRVNVTCPSSSPVSANSLFVDVNVGSVSSVTSPVVASCTGATTTLNAVAGAGTTLVWYNVATGGSPIGTGASINVNPSTLPSTYYVEPVAQNFAPAVYNDGGVSVIGNALGTTSTSTTYVNRFTTNGTIKIVSIKVFPTTAGNMTVRLQNSGSAIDIATATATITTTDNTNTTNGIPKTITCNFVVPAAGNYQIQVTGVSCTIYSSFTGSYSASYMNMNNGSLVFTGAATTATGASSTTTWGAGYSYSIQAACPSSSVARTPVVVSLDPDYEINVTPSTNNVCVGNIQQIDLSSTTAYTSYTWSSATNLFTNAAATTAYVTSTNAPTVYYKATTLTNNTYTVTATLGGCSNTKTVTVSGRALPVIASTTATPAAVCNPGSTALAVTASAAYNASDYTFAQSTGTYTPITGGSVLVSGYDSYDTDVYTVLLSTPFVYQGTSYNTAYVNANGSVVFGASSTSTTPISGGLLAVAGFAADLDAKSAASGAAASEIRWEQVGNEYVFQWFNSCRWTGSGAASAELINFQIRLNTSTGVIRVVYGNCIDRTSPTTTSYPQVGLAGGSASIFNNRTIDAGTSNWTSSTAGTASGNTMAYFGATLPVSGLTFTYTPPVLGSLTYSWSQTPSGSTLSSTSLASITASNITQNTSYSVVVTDVNGCSSTGNATVTTSALTATANAIVQTTVANYNFTQTVGSYSPISGGTVLVSGYDSYDFATYPITLPTPFVFQGVSYSSLQVNADGNVVFGTTTSSTTPISGGLNTVAGFAADLDAKSAASGAAPSEIRWEQVGNEYVFQWFNSCRWTGSGAASAELINFQIRLNYVSGEINLVYGNCVDRTTPTTTGYPQVGLGGGSASVFNNRTIAAGAGDWTSSTAGTASSNTMAYNGSTLPVNGLTFTFTPPSSVTVCQGKGVTLAANASGGGTPYSYSWTIPPSPTVISTSGAFVTTPTATTTYRVVVSDGCGTTLPGQNVTVNVVSNTLVATADDNSLCGAQVANLSASGSTNAYTWSPNLGLSATTGSPVTLTSQVGYASVPVTGFNADLVANGLGLPATSTTATFDGTNYLASADFLASASSVALANSMPSDNKVTSALIQGLEYNLQAYNTNNALRIADGNTYTLTLSTPVPAANLYLLASTGNGPGVANITVTFADATTQSFTGVSILDWFTTTSPSISAVGRVNASGTQTGTATAPNLFDINLDISAANESKNITSISIVRTSTGSQVINVFGVGRRLFTPAATTNYYVSSSINGCTFRSPALAINWTAPPALTLSSSSSTQCQNAQTPLVTLTSNPLSYTSYVWNSDSVTGTAGSGYRFFNNANTNYTLTATNPSTGCSNTATYALTTLNRPYPTATSSATAVCNGSSVNLNATVVYPVAASAYNFAASSATYTPIVGNSFGNWVDDGFNPNDQDWSNSNAIGFNFLFAGNSYNAFGVTTDGVITFGNGTTNLTSSLSGNAIGTSTIPVVAPLWDDMAVTNVNADVTYLLTGSAPSRVLTIQWKNVKWNWNSTAASIEYQAKLYEIDNHIEFIYNTTGTPTSASASIGIANASGAGNYVSLNNASSSAVASSTTATNSISAAPVTGQMFSFTPPAALTYAWTSTPAGFTSSTQNNTGVVPPTVTAPTNYTYKITTSTTSGCTNNSSVVVSVRPTPAVSLSTANAFAICSHNTGSTANANIVVNVTNGVNSNITVTRVAQSGVTGSKAYSVTNATTLTIADSLINSSTLYTNRTVTYTITATAVNGGCSTVQTVVVTVNPRIAPPAATASTQCAPGIPLASVATTASALNGTNNTFDWFTVATGGSAVQTGVDNTYLSSIPSTTNFYVSEKGTGDALGCSSNRTLVKATVLDNNITVTSSGANPVCIGNQFSVGLTNAVTTTPGVSYNWEYQLASTYPSTWLAPSTADNFASNIATGSFVTRISQSLATYYQVTVTCASDGQTVTSQPLLVNQSPAGIACNYCQVSGNSSNPCGFHMAGMKLKSNLLNSYIIDNPNACANTLYSGNSNDGITSLATLYKSYQYTLEVTTTEPNTWVTAWIDLNTNSSFLNGNERVLASTLVANPGVANLVFNVPNTYTNQGNTILRVRSSSSALLASEACVSGILGETENYLITLSNAPNPANDIIGGPVPYPNLVVNNTAVYTSSNNTNASTSVGYGGAWGSGNNFKDVWFTTTVPATGVVYLNVTTTSTTVDHDMQVWTSSNNTVNGTPLTAIGDDDNSGTGNEPFMKVTQPAGTVLFVQIRSKVSNIGAAFSIAATNGINWRGTASTDWDNANNWYHQQVPGSTDDIVIPVTTTQANLNSSKTVRRIYIQSGATAVLNSDLDFTGNVEVYGGNGNGRFRGNGILTTTGNGNTINGRLLAENFTKSLTGTTTTILPTGQLNIVGVYTPASGTMVTNGNLFIRSYNSGSGVNFLGTGQMAFGNGTISGPVSIERRMPITASVIPHLISSPIKGNTSVFAKYNDDLSIVGDYPYQFGITTPTVVYPNSWYYDPTASNTTDANKKWFSASQYPMTSGLGIRLSTPSGVTLDVSGTPQNADTSISIINLGDNLIGNIYPSTIDLDKFIDDNRTVIGSTVYYVNNNTVITYTKLPFVAGVSANTTANVRFMGHSTGFWVDAPGGNTVTFSNAQRNPYPQLTVPGYTPSGTFYASPNSNVLRIGIANATNADMKDEALMMTESTSTDGLDKLLDAKKMTPEGASTVAIYSVVEGQNTAVNVMPTSVEGKEIALGVITPSAGVWNIGVVNSDDYVNELSTLVLEDRLNGKFYNLKANPTVSFTLPEGNIGNRFYLHSGNVTSVKTVANTSDVSIYSNSDKLFVNFGTELKGTTTVEVYNMAGERVLNVDATSYKGLREMSMNKAAAGNYLVKVTNSGNVFTEKVFIEKK